jgi:hypothetical protein
MHSNLELEAMNRNGRKGADEAEGLAILKPRLVNARTVYAAAFRGNSAINVCGPTL